jgi:HSP20 family protein
MVPSLLSSPLFSSPDLFRSHRAFADSFFDDFRGVDFPRFAPPTVEQTDAGVHIDVAVPGFKENEVSVSVDGNLLKIHAEHAEKKEEEKKDEHGKVVSHRKAHSSSTVHESFRLPSGLNVPAMTKQVTDGMLKLTIPKLAIADHPEAAKRAQMAWPPKVTTVDSGDGKHTTLTVELPGVKKEDVRLRVENSYLESSYLYVTVVEHEDGHSFDKCATCAAHDSQVQKMAPNDSTGASRQQYMEGQCTKFCERSCCIRLGHGTTADCVNAKFENEKLVVTVEHKPRSGIVSLH